MSDRIGLIVLSLAGCLISAGCATYNPGLDLLTSNTLKDFPSQKVQEAIQHDPHRIEQERVSVVADFLDAGRTRGVFDANLLAHGIQPVVLVISNGSDQAYRFSKAHVDAPVIPAAEAAKQAFRNQVAYTVGYGISSIPRVILWAWDCVIMRGGAARAAHILVPYRWVNREITHDVVESEIAEATVAPHAFLTGVVFIRRVKPGRLVRLTLLNEQTQEPLVFELIGVNR